MKTDGGEQSSAQLVSQQQHVSVSSQVWHSDTGESQGLKAAFGLLCKRFDSLFDEDEDKVESGTSTLCRCVSHAWGGGGGCPCTLPEKQHESGLTQLQENFPSVDFCSIRSSFFPFQVLGSLRGTHTV